MKYILIFLFMVLPFTVSLSTYSKPDFQTKNWKTIHRLSGSSNRNTDDFTISSKKWKIVWKARKQYDDVYGGNLFIKLVDEEGDADLIANTIPDDEGETTIRKSGSFYFEISSFLTNWEIKVQIEEENKIE